MPKIKSKEEKEREAAEMKARNAEPNGPKAFNTDESDVETTPELKADWEALKNLARQYFSGINTPDDTLHPKQRMTAFALAMEWSMRRIHRASGINYSTIQLWAKRPDVQAFIEEIQFRSGKRDPNEYLDKVQFQALKVMEELMLSKGVTASARLGAAKTLREAKYGKPKETVEHSGDLLRNLYKRLDKEQESPSPDRDEGEAESRTDTDEEHGWVQ